MFKMLSYSQRLGQRADCCVALPFKPCIRKVRVQSFDPNTNRISVKIERRTVDRAEEMRPYKVSDFYLDNLLAVGAQLNPTRLAPSPLKTVSDIAETLSSLDSNINTND